MLPEYQSLREELLRESPQLSEQSLDSLSTLAFEDKFGISYDKAKALEADSQWVRWLLKHPTKVEYIYSDNLKALEDERGRYVSFDLITSDIDQSSQSKNARMLRDDTDMLIPPETIAKVTKQLKGAIINMHDPARVKDFTELSFEGARFGGVGHEHIVKDEDIVPALIIDEVKALDNNSRLNITAKINEHTRRANDVWDMVTKGILRAASIEYNILKDHYRQIEGRVVRVLDDIILNGFTLTSKGRNASCRVNGWFVKALEDPSFSPSSQVIQETKMADEVKKDEKIQDDVKAQETLVESKPSLDDLVKALTEQVASLKSTVEEQAKKIDSVKALEDDKAFVEKYKDVIKDEVKAALAPQEKALVEPEQQKFEIEPIREFVKAATEKGDWSAIAQKHSELHAQGVL